MRRYLVSRITVSLMTILVIVLIMFILMNAMPGTPFTGKHLTAEQLAVLSRKYGLDRPLPERYLKYLFNLLKGDFGVSYNIQKNVSIRSMLAMRLPVTIQIGLLAMFLGTVFGLAFGIISALCHNRPADPVISVISMLGACIPSFVFALALMYFAAYKTGLFPLLYTMDAPFESMILPAVSLSMFPMATIARYTRAEMISVMSSDYILLARSKGVGSFRLVMRHALRNALIPVLTVMAPMLVELITGSMVVESIFSVPGLGSLFVTAVQSNDYNVSITLMFLYSVFYITTMLAVDILYGLIDPRVRLMKEKG